MVGCVLFWLAEVSGVVGTERLFLGGRCLGLGDNWLFSTCLSGDLDDGCCDFRIKGEGIACGIATAFASNSSSFGHDLDVSTSISSFLAAAVILGGASLKATILRSLRFVPGVTKQLFEGDFIGVLLDLPVDIFGTCFFPTSSMCSLGCEISEFCLLARLSSS